MSRQEFMERLNRLLSDIPVNERQEALNYYENYFEDAGPENESKIIEELESPEKVAASIKKDLFGENYGAARQDDKVKDQNTKTQRNILIALVVIITFPIWVGLAGGLFGAVVGLLAAILGVGAALIACVAVFLIVGCALVGMGIAKIVVGFAALGLVVMGIGMLMFTIGLLGVIALVWILGKVIPWLITSGIDLCRRLFAGKKGEVK
ncbi:MAG: DUF1700 domain-containing protein [Lachnospiraceae bacterium]|nr:DUF1700 domain-containing protein [Lachnospiraceae bacterium]MDE6982401.1 DUF1700 domain-containing protein [Lachnospiraceae bacterium]